MAGSKKSRKRPRHETNDNNPVCNTTTSNTNGGNNSNSNKRAKKQHCPQQQHQPSQQVQHAVLVQYYAQVHTLRDWVLSKLPKSSKIRRKKLASLGLNNASLAAPGKTAWSEEEIALGALLDTTLVAIRHDGGLSDGEEAQDPDHRWEKWVAFSQGGGDESNVTLSDGDQQRSAVELQSELVDYVIWLLFSREVKPGTWPKHMLCDGFRKSTVSRPLPHLQKPQGPGPGPSKSNTASSSIPGVFQVHPNHCVKALKEAPWPQLLALVGKAGQRIMLDLLLGCAVFVAVKAGKGNFSQLSGMQISEMNPLTAGPPDLGGSSSPTATNSNSRTVESRLPSEIAFVRSRMFYARPALNARGLVHFGLRHIRMFSSSRAVLRKLLD